MSDTTPPSFFARLKSTVLGGARDLRDPALFHKLSLVAFVAWVGLGADGLSSANYGPEESFLTLGTHGHLGIFVALATAITIFVIASSYSQIVELFPSGGGGYIVASRLLSPTVGMISGCALLIDYVLTITLSVASGADAIFSFLPLSMQSLKIVLALVGVLGLTVLNLRGVRESVVPLIPIFLLFLLTHAFAVIYGIVVQVPHIGQVVRDTAAETRATAGNLGILGLFVLILRSYGMGAGTYTGIEAVSNGIPILREPRVATAKRTMKYMSVSLAFMAFGLMVGYLLFDVVKEPGKTLNATLMESISRGWGPGGQVFVLLALVSEAVLLFVAAQTGFLDGPRVLANMSIDRWLPTQFGLLSERLVIKNGIYLMGGAALVLMIASRGSVKLLLVLYAINVFITFFLSQLGMVLHWWKERHGGGHWKRRLAVVGVGLILTAFILVSQIVLKFSEGGWITLLVTGSLVAVAFTIRKFYARTGRRLARLDTLMTAVTEIEDAPAAAERALEEAAEGTTQGGATAVPAVARSRRQRRGPGYDRKGKTAVLLVSGFNGTGLHTLFNVRKIFGDTFRNWFFIEAGIIDVDRFRGADALDKLTVDVEKGLDRYVRFLKSEGFYARGFAALGTDISDEICGLAERLHGEYPGAVFFGGQIVFPEDTFLTRLLFNHTTFAVQRRLHQLGIPFLVMPIRIQ